jgi:hypothetical protein
MVEVVASCPPCQQYAALFKVRLVIILLLSFIPIAFFVACQSSPSLPCILTERMPTMQGNPTPQIIVPEQHCHPRAMCILTIDPCGLCCNCHHLAIILQMTMMMPLQPSTLLLIHLPLPPPPPQLLLFGRHSNTSDWMSMRPPLDRHCWSGRVALPPL